jgi:hypothetical protein
VIEKGKIHGLVTAAFVGIFLYCAGGFLMGEVKAKAEAK